MTLVDGAFGGLAPGEGRQRRQAPGPNRPAQLHHPDDTEQVQLLVGMRALDRFDDDREALDVLVHILGGGMSSRLFDEIREQRGLAYSVYAATSQYDDAGALSVYAGTQPDHLDEVAGLIEGTLADLAVNGITGDELGSRSATSPVRSSSASRTTARGWPATVPCWSPPARCATSAISSPDGRR